MITTPRQTTRRYDIVPHADIPDLAGQIHALAAVAFGAYPGVLAPHLAHREWYIRRPGMDRDLSMGILCDGRLVASVFVTQAPVRLGGRPLSLGIVDTVMSHPDHRRQGLARWALSAAVDAMRERGLAGSLLYTVEDSMPAHFYESMGYVAHVPVRYYRAPRTARPTGHPSPRPAEQAETYAVIRFLNGALAEHDGYIPVDQPLWQWRRLGRPAALPASTWVIDSPGGYSGSVTACRARVVAAGGGEPACNVLTDLAVAPGADPRATIAALLGAVPGGCEARTLSADTEEPVNAALEELGFSVTAREVAMVLPLSPEAAGATRDRPAHWYALAESVIGV
jgi:GNAT superfamily N-acetyltransferase